MITTQDLETAIQDIKDGRGWVKYSLSKAEYMGMRSGLIRLLRHLERVSEEKNTICIEWGVDDIYLGTWYVDSNDVEVNSNVNGNGEWNNSKESMKMTKNQDGSFSFKFKPTVLYQDNGIGKIGVLAKAKNGTGDKKTPDFFFEVGINFNFKYI